MEFMWIYAHALRCCLSMGALLFVTSQSDNAISPQLVSAPSTIYPHPLWQLKQFNAYRILFRPAIREKELDARAQLICKWSELAGMSPWVRKSAQVFGIANWRSKWLWARFISNTRSKLSFIRLIRLLRMVQVRENDHAQRMRSTVQTTSACLSHNGLVQWCSHMRNLLSISCHADASFDGQSSSLRGPLSGSRRFTRLGYFQESQCLLSCTNPFFADWAVFESFWQCLHFGTEMSFWPRWSIVDFVPACF